MVRRLKLLHGHWTKRDLLPLLPDAEECMELISGSRLVGTALRRIHQGKLRLPTRRRARLLKLESFSTDWRLFRMKLVLLFVWALSGYRIARLSTQRRPRRLRLSQQPQG